MLSARSEEVDKVRGLETGADDYVIKPYSIIELMARLRAQLRRVRPSTLGMVLEWETITLDAETHRVIRDGQTLKLGPTEFRLLATFLEKPGRVFSREQLLDRVWGRDIYVDSRTVDVHVGRLRKALCAFGADDPLRTVRGAGYALHVTGSERTADSSRAGSPAHRTGSRSGGSSVSRIEDLASGWLQGEYAWGRPTDVLAMPDGSLLIADDQQGLIYRLAETR
jgi:DNA-binding winged helix-turn-helix (wHTH) protein